MVQCTWLCGMPEHGRAEAVLQMWGHVAAPVLCSGDTLVL